MGLHGVLLWSGLLGCAGASFFFALAETALFSLGKRRAQQLGESRQGRHVMRLLEQPSDLLATIVLGNTMANSCLVTLALWPALNGSWNPVRTLAGVLVFILVCCEVLPKTLAVRAPQRWALRVAVPMVWLQNATRWFQRLSQSLNSKLLDLVIPASVKPSRTTTDEDYQELLEMAYQQGTLASSEKEIILQIISLDRKTARDVMQPRATMASISDELSIEEMVEAARKFKHVRLPIYDETPDTIVGILNTRILLLDPEINLENAIEFPSFVPDTMNLLQLLKSLQRQHRGMAIVLDEYGGTAGLVTLEDILEEVVGEIRHEGEPTGFLMEQLEEGKWRVNGIMRLNDFSRECPQLGDVQEVDTVGGLVIARMEVVPHAGQSTVFRGLRLTASVVEDRRVLEVMVERLKKR